VAALACTGTLQGAQLVPQELTLVFDWQSPEQSWLPPGQVPTQAIA
jgi:hypothetical protein